MRSVMVLGALLLAGCDPATTAGVATDEINVVFSATTDGEVETTIDVVAELTRADVFENPLNVGTGDRFVASHLGVEVELEEVEVGIVSGSLAVDGTDTTVLTRPVLVEFLRDSEDDATDTRITLPDPYTLTVTDDRGRTLDDATPNLMSTPLLISWTDFEDDIGVVTMQITVSTDCTTNTFVDSVDDAEGSYELPAGTIRTTDESFATDCGVTIEALRQKEGTADPGFATARAYGQQRREVTGDVDIF